MSPDEHPDATVVRQAYRALNQGDIDGYFAAVHEDAVWHGSGRDIRGRAAIRSMVEQLVELGAGSLQVDLHDVLATDDHVVVLQVTRAERGGRRLADRVAYVYHLRDGKIAEAWFQGDPRVQDEFWS